MRPVTDERREGALRIPLVDLRAQHAEIADEVMEGWARVVESCSFVLGDEVEAFERAFAELSGVPYCVGVGNGTDALELALRVVGVRPGDEVILPTNSFIATAFAVARTGATPILVDVETGSLLIDPQQVLARVGSAVAWPRVVEPPRLAVRECPLCCLASFYCHPALAPESRVALTLKTVGGLSVREIARAFLTKEATIAQRIVRVKRQIRRTKISFDLPSQADLPGQLESVLEVIYFLFNEGYSAHTGENLVRSELVEEAIRLGRLLIRHPATDLPKCHALLALMLLQAARTQSRVSREGEMILLREQDRSHWDRHRISQGLIHLERSAEGDQITEYHLQAGIAACHTTAKSYEETDWGLIVSLYDLLLVLNPSPVAALNRAVALSKWRGLEKGITALHELEAHPALREYHLLWATLADLWKQYGGHEKAASYYQRALQCLCSEPERRFLIEKLEAIQQVPFSSKSEEEKCVS